jgi:kynurenine formamidase
VTAGIFQRALPPRVTASTSSRSTPPELPQLTSQDLRVHRAFIGRGIVIIEEAARLRELLDRRFDFHAPFSRLVGAEGAVPARIFLVVHDPAEDE